MTVVNAGTIAGTTYAVQFAAGYANRLIVDPGAVFTGQVSGGNTIGAAQVSTLELASAGSAGTLSGLGTQYVDFAQVTVDAGTIAGAYTSNYNNADGVYLSDGGSVTNQATGNIYGRNDGVLITGARGTVVNLGSIHSRLTAHYGGEESGSTRAASSSTADPAARSARPISAATMAALYSARPAPTPW